jgi:beta-lactamase superfamily II metal-dependent hydrolase
MKSLLIAVMALAFATGAIAQNVGAKTLDIYFIDVEGGQATLLVTPQGEALLIDTGFPGSSSAAPSPGAAATSHASRIAAAALDAGVKRIDYLLITHFHGDHVGGVAELAQQLPIGTFIDHGSLAVPERTNAQAMTLFDAYAALRDKGRHLEPKPGDRLPLKGIEATVVSSAAEVLVKPLKGAGGSNAACEPSARPAADAGENARSTGVVVSWGKFRFLDIGDLTTRPLFDLVCPKDLVGAVDVYLVAHHGNPGAAKAETFAAFKPRVAIVNNGAKKGGSREIFDYLQQDRSLQGVWQLHRAEASGTANFADERIANLDESTAHYIKVSAKDDGSFRVLNARTGKWTEYGPR